MSPSSFEQHAMFPDRVPTTIARRIWAEALAYYDTGTPVALTQRKISERLLLKNPELPGSLATVERAFRDPANREWLHWPIKRGERPPWEPQPSLEPVVDAAPVIPREEDALNLEGQLVRVFQDEDGLVHLVLRRIAMLAAAVWAAVVLLDGMDGHVDRIIHWCAVFSNHWTVLRF